MAAVPTAIPIPSCLLASHLLANSLQHRIHPSRSWSHRLTPLVPIPFAALEREGAEITSVAGLQPNSRLIKRLTISLTMQ